MFGFVSAGKYPHRELEKRKTAIKLSSCSRLIFPISTTKYLMSKDHNNDSLARIQLLLFVRSWKREANDFILKINVCMWGCWITPLWLLSWKLFRIYYVELAWFFQDKEHKIQINESEWEKLYSFGAFFKL